MTVVLAYVPYSCQHTSTPFKLAMLIRYMLPDPTTAHAHGGSKNADIRVNKDGAGGNELFLILGSGDVCSQGYLAATYPIPPFEVNMHTNPIRACMFMGHWGFTVPVVLRCKQNGHQGVHMNLPHSWRENGAPSVYGGQLVRGALEYDTVVVQQVY